MSTNEILDKITGSDLTLNGIISGGITLFLGLIAVGAFASLIYSGFMYITAGGDASKTEKAKKNILWAIIGVILAVSSYVLIQLVVSVFDSSSTNSPTNNSGQTPTNQQNNQAQTNPTTSDANTNKGPVDDIVN